MQIIETIEQQLNEKNEENFEERLREAIDKEKKAIYEQLEKEFEEKFNEKLSQMKSESRSLVKSPAKRRMLSENSSDDAKETSKQANFLDQNDDQNRLIEVQVIDDIYFDSDSGKNQIDTIELNVDTNESSLLSEDDIIEENTEYLDEDTEDLADDYYMESILPAIQKTIASKSGIHLDEETTYKISKKRGNEIEVECTTSDGKIFCVEMVMDDHLPNVRRLCGSKVY